MIRFDRLRKEYDDLVAVDELQVLIPAGEIYGLIGPNGAGKTTTIRMVCGLLEPTMGRVFVNDVDVHSDPERAQGFIGYLSDFFSVYEDLKVWEYLDYFAHAYKMPEGVIAKRIDEVIEQVNLEVKRDQMIKGLSRGMKQRLPLKPKNSDPHRWNCGDSHSLRFTAWQKIWVYHLMRTVLKVELFASDGTN